MEKTYLRHSFWSIIVLLITIVSMFSACSKDDDDSVEISPKCAITSFSVSDITSYVPYTSYDASGNASTSYVARTLSGKSISFNIDQVNGTIFTVDSLPKWVTLGRIMPTFTSYGYVMVNAGDGIYYGLTSGSDSLDISHKQELLCISTDGSARRTYILDVRKRSTDTDTLEWKQTTSDLDIKGLGKPFSTDGKVFVFAHDASGNSTATYASNDNPASWHTPVTIPVDATSVVMFRGAFYGLGADNLIYTSTPALEAATWTKASDNVVTRLLAADDYYIYAYDGTAIIGSSDLSTWTQQGTANLDRLPETCMNYFSYPSKANSKIQTAVMTGRNSLDNSRGVTWHKTSSGDADTNQSWAYIQITGDNAYGLLPFGDMSTTYLNGSLYVLGTESGEYTRLYRSDDHGITWHILSEKYPLPADLKAAGGAACIATVGSTLWIIQENGKVWQGSIR